MCIAGEEVRCQTSLASTQEVGVANRVRGIRDVAVRAGRKRRDCPDQKTRPTKVSIRYFFVIHGCSNPRRRPDLVIIALAAPATCGKRKVVQKISYMLSR